MITRRECTVLELLLKKKERKKTQTRAEKEDTSFQEIRTVQRNFEHSFVKQSRWRFVNAGWIGELEVANNCQSAIDTGAAVPATKNSWCQSRKSEKCSLVYSPETTMLFYLLTQCFLIEGWSYRPATSVICINLEEWGVWGELDLIRSNLEKMHRTRLYKTGRKLLFEDMGFFLVSGTVLVYALMHTLDTYMQCSSLEEYLLLKIYYLGTDYYPITPLIFSNQIKPQFDTGQRT